jgi:hypothetical protein
LANFDDVLKVATLPTRIVSLCLAGELLEELDSLERQLAAAKPATNLAESPQHAIAEQIKALQEQMRESTVEFHLRAMGARVFAAYWANRPERADGETDEAWDERSFADWTQLISRSCADPQMTAEQVAELADVLHARAWNELASACLTLNTGEVDIPNSAAASVLTLTSEQT